MCYGSRTAFRAAAVGLFKHSPDIPVTNFQVLLFLYLFDRMEDAR